MKIGKALPDVVLMLLPIVFWVACCNDVDADVIWLAGQRTPLHGKVVSKNDLHVKFQVLERGTYQTPQTIARDQIETMVVNIDVERLEKLNPTSWAQYRDYAEELAAQKSDPAARQLARRLYLIAAANGDTDLRRSALLGMIALSGTEKERQQLEVLRFLSVPGSPPPDLAVAGKSNKPPTQSAEASRTMLELVHLIRRGRTEEAAGLLQIPANQTAYKAWSHICSLEELKRMVNSSQVNKGQLFKLLTIELELVAAENAVLLPRKAENWGELASKVTNRRELIPTFSNVTEFDPTKTVYRDGRWVVPDSRQRQVHDAGDSQK